MEEYIQVYHIYKHINIGVRVREYYCEVRELVLNLAFQVCFFAIEFGGYIVLLSARPGNTDYLPT